VTEPISPTTPPLAGRAVASQRWSKVTFLHWRVAASVVAPLLPEGIAPDEHDGSSWVGLIAFQLDRATLFGSPPVPYFGSFAEVNVRLYGVDSAGRRGVVFRSLEASRLAAVLAARAAFSIPYFWSRTSLAESDGVVDYRADRHVGAGATRIRVRPGSPVQPDATAAFLTARWALFTRRLGRTILLPNAHEPWPLREAHVLDLDDSLTAEAGLPGVTSGPPDSVLYSEGVTTRFGQARVVRARSADAG
jgi:uncharacterized protein YqjF (DUF2071 family)